MNSPYASLSWAASLPGHACLAGGVRADVPPSCHSIPVQERRRLEQVYGVWAVRQAEAFCPQKDVACVEREAKRLFEVTGYRSGGEGK